MSKLISCIIPMFNAEKYIEKCIRSVLAQTYAQFEIIVIDDGSLDNSAAIVQDMAKTEPRIRLIQTENRGVSAARNRGLENVRGEYVAFLDADDMLPSNAFEILLQDILELGVDIAVGKDSTYTINGKYISSTFSNEVKVWAEEEALVACLSDVPNTWNVCGKLFSVKILEGLTFREGRKIGEDSWFFFQCCLKCPKVSYRDCCVYYVYLSNNSATRSKMTKQKIEDISFFTDEKVRIIQEKFPQYVNLALHLQLNAKLLVLSGLIKEKDCTLMKEKKEIIRFIRANKKYMIRKSSKNKRIFNAVIYRYLLFYEIMRRIKGKN